MTSSQAAEITFFGLLDVSAGAYKTPGGNSATGVDSSRMTTSFFGVKGAEDLGNGYSAVFRLESFLRVDVGEAGRARGDKLFARNSTVGVEHKQYGRITLGRNTSTLFISTLLFNAFRDSAGYSPAIRHYFLSGTVTGDTGWDDSIGYYSPNWGGLRVSGVAALKEDSNGGNYNLSVGYGNKKWALRTVFQEVKKDNARGPVDDTRAWQLSGSYNIAKTRLFAQYGTVDNDTTSNSFDILGLGVSIPVGPGNVLLQWGSLAPESGADRNTASIGYDVFLSRRTDVYAAFLHDKIDGLSAGQSYSLGMRHRF